MVVLLLAGAANAWAWSGGGHKVVGLIAWSQSDPETREKVVTILKAHPRWQEDFAAEMPAEIVSGTETERQRWIFAHAAIWSDKIRRLPDYHRPTWHYINEPVFLSDADKEALAGDLKTNVQYSWNAQTDEATQNAPQTVDRALKTLRDSAASPADKAVMLCWLFHDVGDLHQPLHCVALFTKRVFREGDRGGNSIELQPADRPRETISLHSLWDRLLKVDATLNEASATMQSVLAEEGVVERAAAAARSLDPKKWVAEGGKIARKSVYTDSIRAAVQKAENDPNFDLPKVRIPVTGETLEAYGKQAGAVGRERAVVAGYRLAALLGRVAQ
jgi:hypothetical protein